MNRKLAIAMAIIPVSVFLAFGAAGVDPRGEADVKILMSGTEKPQKGEVTMNEEIQALIQTYQRGLNESKVDLVKSVYAADAIFIGQPFPTATGVDAIAALYAGFLSKLDFNVEFEILEIELGENLGFVRTRSHGTIVPKGQAPKGSEGNREVFVVKKIKGAWKFYRYIFNAEV